MDWDDARVFLAVLRAGSLSGAARSLGCSHSTVRRRLDGLEAALDVPLFVASSDGLTPTDVAREAMPGAEAIEREALAFQRQVSGGSAALQGKIRVTTIDALVGWLAPALTVFGSRHPRVVLDLITADRPLDLARREADVAVRITHHPPPTSFGRRVARFEFAPFAAPELIARCGNALESLPWALYSEESQAVLTEQWYRSWSTTEPALRVSGGGPLMTVVEAGVAAGLLPIELAGTRDLVRLGPSLPGFGAEVWCLTHVDLKASARIRALMDCVGEISKSEPLDS